MARVGGIARRAKPGPVVRATYDTLSSSKALPGPPGGFTLGSTYLGGPLFVDAFGSKRAPSPWELIEKYKSLIYAMVAKNANARCRVPLRLYADASRGTKPKSISDPVKVTKGIGRRLAGIEYTRVSPSAVDDVHEIRTHPILDCLDRPDPYGYFDRTKILSLISRYCDVVGSAYFMPEGNGWREDNGGYSAQGQIGVSRKGPPIWLWVLYSQYVQPVRMAGSPLIAYFQYFADRIPYDQLLWFRTNHSLRDPYGAGYSPTYAGGMYADLEDRFVAIQDQLLGIGPRPNLIATAKDPLQPPGELERKRFEQELRQKHSEGYAGGVLINTGAWDFTPATYSPADLAGLEISTYDLNRLCNLFGVPPSYFSTDTNLANLQAADTQHARDGVEPWCTTVASQLTNIVRTFDQRLFFAFDDCVPEDEERDARIIDMKLKSGLISINEANEETQWTPKWYGEEPWIPGTLVQPSMAKERHQQGLEQGQAAIKQTQTSTANDDIPAFKAIKAKENGKESANAGNGKRSFEPHLDDLTPSFEPFKSMVSIEEYAKYYVDEEMLHDFLMYVSNAPSYDSHAKAATLFDCREAHRLAIGPPKEQAINSTDKEAFELDLDIPRMDNVIGDGDPAPDYNPQKDRKTAMNLMIDRALDRLEKALA